MNFAKFAATSPSRRAEFRGGPAANWNNLLTAREFSDVKGKTEYQKIRVCLLGPRRGTTTG
jgi:hypothetical protein